uniref:NADH dehydrogenase [ubiquinone] 1 alpha subcomplex subunit 11 n=2 Tax=Entomoneis paludosa TaxID=265537 RepID=A0A7S2YA41_9STRA|mmetsp:Transcript_2382/g.4968  ORF Transcript_2382/g.4968 Transcript_2382/m.4968 type:complete len:158 (+) Transcript_2382:64-537(+)
MSGALTGFLGGAMYTAFMVPEQIERYNKVKAAELQKFTASSAVLARPMFWCTLVSVTHTGVSCLAEYARDKDKTSPWWNSFAGGVASGLVVGALTKRFDVAATSSLVLGLFSLGVKFDDTYRNDMRYETKRIFTEDTYESNVTEKFLKRKYPDYKDM